MSHADWSLKSLDTIGDYFSIPTAINDSGQVKGSYLTDNINSGHFDSEHHHAFITDPGGIGMRDIDTFDAYSSQRCCY